jgi:hypothetical protein
MKNPNLKAIISKKLAALDLSGYSAKMIMNRADDPSALRAAKALPVE